MDERPRQALRVHSKVRTGTNRGWISKGAGPSLENYRSWILTPTGLRVFFDEYQVACYAEGGKEVVIPWAVLQNILDPVTAAPVLAGIRKPPRAGK